MTPSDDEIRAACGTLLTEYDWATMSIDAIRLRLYRAAYAAGMEAAAVMLERMAMAGSDFEPSTDDSVALYDAAADIRAANGREGKS